VSGTPRSGPRLSVYIACSLDGYIATLDGKLDWLISAGRADEDYGYDEFMGTIDALAMGRGTYDFISDVDPWPFEGKPVFVFTHRPPAPRLGVTFLAEPPLDAVARWTDDGYNRVYVDGGQIISSFLAEGLIDDITLTVAPRLLGRGIKLFQPGGEASKLELLATKSYPSGMVTLKYTIEADGQRSAG
jgi:dihydrofolate reductase